MLTQTVEKEILELEKKYWQAIKDKDIDTAMALTDEPSIVVGATGVASFDKETFRKMIKSEQCILDSFKINDKAEVRRLTDDVVILAYKVHEELTVEGKKVSIDAAESSTWIRRAGRWVCALHTEALAGDPYGRDRR